MNVHQMLEEIAERWPSATVTSEWQTKPFHYSLVHFDNEWTVGIGYGDVHYSDTRLRELEDPRQSEAVEIAIFDERGDWYVSESMTRDPGSKSAVLGWQDSDQVFRILDYISRMRGPPSTR